MTPKKKPSGVILVSYEIPPRRLTAFSNKIAALANLLFVQNIPTFLVTFDDWRSDIEHINDYFTIYRIPNSIPTNISEFARIMNLKPSYQSVIGSIYHTQQIDLIHFFNWQTFPTLISWSQGLTCVKILSSLILQAEVRAESTPYNDGLKKLEEMAFTETDFILSPKKELSNKILSYYSNCKAKIITQKIDDEEYSKKLLKTYERLLKDSTKGGK
ncbi:MAG: hypothetical protein U9O98_11415 [Asgard group archaeon]|nr:hypothetical protein [Asgard group archaeon]